MTFPRPNSTGRTTASRPRKPNVLSSKDVFVQEVGGDHLVVINALARSAPTSRSMQMVTCSEPTAAPRRNFKPWCGVPAITEQFESERTTLTLLFSKGDNKIRAVERGDHHLSNGSYFSQEFRYCGASRRQEYEGQKTPLRTNCRRNRCD